ncbi:MAG: sigma-54-dependent Fis family transcriptional regulator [Verrucomicrobia bacterium]|nr:sigma-54-dependent Fis family transcriptional regulator [Verrucomicrobiota bacterium]
MTDREHSVLVVDDEPAVRNALKSVLEDDYRIVLASDGLSALETLRTNAQIDVVLLDMVMPGMHGIEVLRRVRSEFASVEVIILSALQSIETVVEAINLGAFDYVTKPFVARELALIVDRAIELRTLKRQIRELRETTTGLGHIQIIGASAAAVGLKRRAQELAHERVALLIAGERGVGKEHFARVVHWRHHGRSAPFTAVRCADLVKQQSFRALTSSVASSLPVEPSGLGLPCQGLVLFKEADRLSTAHQAALAAIINELADSGVCVGATVGPNIGRMLDEGRIDPSLYRAVAGAVVVIPPLRERYEDIKPLAEHFIQKLRVARNAAAERISAEAVAELETYLWPGNVCELRNFIERILILHADAPVIERQHLPDEIGATAARALSATDFIGKKTLKEAVNDLERRIIQDALRRAGGVQTKASDLLGTTRRILRYKMQQLGLE